MTSDLHNEPIRGIYTYSDRGLYGEIIKNIFNINLQPKRMISPRMNKILSIFKKKEILKFCSILERKSN